MKYEVGNTYKIYKLLGYDKQTEKYTFECTKCGSIGQTSASGINNTRGIGCKKCLNQYNGTHHLSKTPIYKAWKEIKSRCYCKGATKYYMYGAVGITMCDEWKNDFKSFYDWSMANGYSDEKEENGLRKYTIDRIDNSKGYSPENCRWVDKYVQANNKRNVKLYEYNGEMLSIMQIGRIVGIDGEKLYNRVHHLKWDLKKAIETPFVVGRNQYTK